MHDAVRVGGIERVGHLDGHVDEFADWDRPAGETFGERLAFEVFHDEVRLASASPTSCTVQMLG